MALFDNLSEKLQKTVNKLRSKGRVTEKDVKEMMREIRLALLEADVNYKVVREFTSRISERAVGQDVMESLTPGQQVIKIIHGELINLLGGETSRITYGSTPPSVYMLIGLQGAGKTTFAGKLALSLKKDGKSPMLIACDVYRPAAVQQLKIVGEQAKADVFSMESSKDPVKIAMEGIREAVLKQNDVVIIDTAGRLHIDDELMDELSAIKRKASPQEVLLVVDSMTGQDAVNVAESFNNRLGIDGVVLTKLDGDTRGGAALSVRSVTGKPIKYASVGEKLADLELFYPDRMASRILGMGDVLSLIEKAQESFDEKKAMELEKKIRSQQFTLEDFLDQMQELKKMGPLDQLVGMLPGLSSKMKGDMNIDEGKLKATEAIIRSMTVKERVNPSIINARRKKRISAGSGTRVQDVNRLLRDFEEMKKMMKMFDTMGKRGKKQMQGIKLPF